ncbi:MAG: glutathione S-transferase family protein [Dehalococcoidia bacterium]
MILYDHPLSGNGHKVRLLLSMLELDAESRFVDVPNHAHVGVGFERLNPLLEIPVLEDGDLVVSDSQAILVHLARKHGPIWYPIDPPEVGQVQRWLSFAAVVIATSLQPLRLVYLLNEEHDVAKLQERCARALGVLDGHLSDREWLVGERPTIADLACFPYVGLCGDAQLSLASYSAVKAWTERVRMLPGYVSMPGIG